MLFEKLSSYCVPIIYTFSGRVLFVNYFRNLCTKNNIGNNSLVLLNIPLTNIFYSFVNAFIIINFVKLI